MCHLILVRNTKELEKGHVSLSKVTHIIDRKLEINFFI